MVRCCLLVGLLHSWQWCGLDLLLHGAQEAWQGNVSQLSDCLRCTVPMLPLLSIAGALWSAHVSCMHGGCMQLHGVALLPALIWGFNAGLGALAMPVVRTHLQCRTTIRSGVPVSMGQVAQGSVGGLLKPGEHLGEQLGWVIRVAMFTSVLSEDRSALSIEDGRFAEEQGIAASFILRFWGCLVQALNRSSIHRKAVLP